MKKKAMRKNLHQSILKSLGRYLAIVGIIALGSSMFVGLLMTKTDMVATGQKYMDQQNMFDLRLMSTYGWEEAQLQQLRQDERIEDAEGIIYLDVIACLGESTEGSVYRFYSMPQSVNQVVLRGGRMPERADECLIDGYIATDDILGTTITVAEGNSEDTLDALVYQTYTIVGYVSTPLYMDMNRGTTSVGNGSIQTYLFVPREGLNVDYYSEINLTIPGSFEVYSDRYTNALEAAAEELDPVFQTLATDRFGSIQKEAVDAYREGEQEYLDGLAEFEEGKKEAEQSLSDALQELKDAEQEIADNEKLLQDGQDQINYGWQTIAENEKFLKESREELENAKADAYGKLDEAQAELDKNAKEVNDALTQVEAGLSELEAGLSQVNDGITQLEAAIPQMEDGIAQLEEALPLLEAAAELAETALKVAQAVPGADPEKLAELEAEVQNLTAQRDNGRAQLNQLRIQLPEYKAQLQSLYGTRTELEKTRAELIQTKNTLTEAKAAIDAGFEELNSARAEADAQFMDAQQQLSDGEAELQNAKNTLSAKQGELNDGLAALEEGREELRKGWQEYYDGKAEAEAEIADAEKELADAKVELDDAWKQIQDMAAAEIFVLDRSSNVGYGSLDSSSDIVQGVSRVFPVFFLLVAALVCITTMTRMIDEERTQIGTLKALGYSEGEIISKYLIYAGSGAILGCGLGVLVGSALFPKILWQAYKIMLYISDDLVIRFNWWLCGAVVFAYTSVMLLVTWYCCRRALREQPAELIRPKAPEAGKKILLERLPFWNSISFLNKVTIRNIFRYRQRLAMMMVGIGGCTALLLTGFGLRDSIVNVVDYQFEDVTVYDIQVYFSEGRTEEDAAAFLEEMGDGASGVHFYHQQSVEMDFDNRTREIYLMAADEGIREFIDFHSGSRTLPMPERNEVLLSTGVAEAMGIDVGDTVTLRTSDLDTLSLRVCGIYENHVNNYALVIPETMEQQWGEAPERQMALIKASENTDAHSLSAKISGMEDVMTVSVSSDLADMVGNMMDALDLVVIVVVVCAGLLAVIVLYNLTNININERIREIATIKVLGFNAAETSAYVFKENLSLSAIGSVLGLGFGYLLLLFVMSQIKLDIVWFKPMIKPVSYFLALGLTMISACLVDFIFYFKLEKINMAEALKSVE